MTNVAKHNNNHSCSVQTIQTLRLGNVPEVYNVSEFYVSFSKRTSRIGLQAIIPPRE